MAIKNLILIIPALCGIIFIITGFILLKFPSKKINIFYGYRTPGSMKSQERWDFAQKYASKEMIRLGILLGLSGLIGLAYHPNERTGAILGLGLMIAMAIVLIIRVERAIKNKFGNNN